MISLQFEGPVARLQLDRPSARNALSREGWQALAAAIEQVRTSAARVLLLDSAHDAGFCAGSDLGEIAALKAVLGGSGDGDALFDARFDDAEFRARVAAFRARPRNAP